MLNQNLKGTSLFRTALLTPMMITPVIVGLTWRFLYNPSFGFLNYLLNRIGLNSQEWLTNPKLVFSSILIVDVWQWTPLLILMLLAGLQSLPDTLYESAEIDGASGLSMLRYVTIPLLKPIIVLGLLLRTMDAIRVFDTVFMMTRGGPGTQTELASIYLYLKGLKNFHMGEASAVAILVLFCTLVLSFVFFKYLLDEEASTL